MDGSAGRGGATTDTSAIGTGGYGPQSPSEDAPGDSSTFPASLDGPVPQPDSACVAPARACEGRCVAPDEFCAGTCGTGFHACKGTCAQGTLPTEKCDGADNDCDEEVDEGNLCEAPPNGTAVCKGMQGCAKLCNADFKECDGRCIAVAEICGTSCSASFYSCRGMCLPGARPAEKCDGVDNDCNGTIDDGNLCPAPQNGTATCGGSSGCQPRCNANFRDCGGGCASCPSVPNGSVGCQGTSCVMTGCSSGYRNCGGRCVTCPSVSNARVACEGTSCVVVGCDDGFRSCGNNRCIPSSGCCEACNDPSNGRAECVGGVCSVVSCNVGFFKDGNNCRACGNTDRNHCGPSCQACPGNQDCVAGRCVDRCVAGCEGDIEVTCPGGSRSAKRCDHGCRNGVCNECSSDMQCPEGGASIRPGSTAGTCRSCVAGKCMAINSGGTCDSGGGVCGGGNCLACGDRIGATCCPGAACFNGLCDASNGFPCVCNAGTDKCVAK
jgi:hypothetical protein